MVGSASKLTIGILADPDQVPDVEAIRDALIDELDLLHTAVVGSGFGESPATMSLPNYAATARPLPSS